MKKLQVLVDLDGIVVDLLDTWLDLYNNDWDDQLTHADIGDWNMHKNVAPECGLKIYDYLEMPGTFLNSPPIPGAVDALRRIKESGHDITIVSAPANASHTYSQKIDWCRQHLPFLGKNDVILAKKKHIIYGDLLIDDAFANLDAFKKAWPNSMTATIGYPYNTDAKPLVDLYADDWKDFAGAWNKIESFIEQVSEQD